MSALDTAKAVLAKASLLDQTFATPDLGIAVAWAEVLGDLDQRDAVRAVAEHYTAQTRRIMPADVKDGVRRIRADRFRAVPSDVLEPLNAPDDLSAFIAGKRARIAAIAAGRVIPPESGRADRSGDVAELLESTTAALPSVPGGTP